MNVAIPRVDVLGVGISAVDMAMAEDEITRWIETREQHYVCVTGVHGVMESQRDLNLLAVHNASGLTTPDGMPMVWAGHWAGAHWMTRVYGPDLMLSVLQRAAERGWRSFFYGGKDGVAELLATRLKCRYPALEVAGVLAPPFRPLSPTEDQDVVDQINATGAELVWVGLSTPKQELWMAEHAGRLEAPVLLGVGAAFDFHAGLIPQAPTWMQANGLEWSFRLAKEPRRLWKRYLRSNPAFVTRILRDPPRLQPSDADEAQTSQDVSDRSPSNLE